MRKLVQIVLWLFVFVLPWEPIAWALLGRFTFAMGVLLFGVGTVVVLAIGTVRRLTPIVLAALLFAVASVFSLMWTVAVDATLVRAFTYVQLFVFVWMLQEFVTTRKFERSLYLALCLGALIPVGTVLWNWLTGNYLPDAATWASGELVRTETRFSARNYNANDLGLTLVLGIPFAWQLLMEERRVVRFVSAAYLALAPIAVLLTASRGAFIAGLVAVGVIPLSLRRTPLRFSFVVPVLLIVVGIGAAAIIPSQIWERFRTIPQEIAGQGTLTGRTIIWTAGWRAFLERPILGSGAGTFGDAVSSSIAEDRLRFSHNLPLGILVEQGAIGMLLFTILLGACAITIRKMAPADRTTWTVVMCTWFVGVLSVGWQYQKLTWLLFGLLAARRAGHLRESVPVAHARSVVPSSLPQRTIAVGHG